MNNIHIVTDSTSDLPADIIDNYNVSIIPIQVLFEDKVYRDREDISLDELFARVPESTSFPKTSQPPVGEFITLFNEIIAKGQEILGVFLAEELSGTINAARLAARRFSADQITIIDSRQVHSGLGLQVIKACEMVQTGLSRLEVASQLKKLQKSINMLVCLDTLDYVFRGGRLSRLEAGIGNLLNIKPLLEVVDGKVKTLAKIRGKRRLYRTIIRELEHRVRPGQLIRVIVGEAWAVDQARELKKEIENRFNCDMLDIVKTGIGLGTHVGPGVVAVAFHEV